MGGIGNLLSGLLGSILPFAKGGVIRGNSKDYIVKVKPHVRKLPIGGKNVDKYKTKLNKKIENTDFKFIR
jgi:hypothetical protein